MVAFGNAIGRNIHSTAESTRHGLNLFACLVGDTSNARKGTSWGHIERLFSLALPKWFSTRVTSGLSSAEGLIVQVRDGDEGPRDHRLLVLESRFARVLKIMQRSGNTLSTTLRSAWDGRLLSTLVKNGPLKASNAHIGIIGHITQEELIRYLSETDRYNGFSNRILWVCVRRSKCLPEGGSVPPAEIETLARRLRIVMKWARNAGDLELNRDSNARDLWFKVYPELSDGKAGLVGAVTSRGVAQVLRLSALYAVLDCSSLVRVEHLEAALALWKYCFDSAQYIFDGIVGRSLEDRIREALDSAGSAGMTKTDIRDLFGRHGSAKRIDQVLHHLASIDVISRRGVRTNGRSSTLWATKTATDVAEGDE